MLKPMKVFFSPLSYVSKKNLIVNKHKIVLLKVFQSVYIQTVCNCHWLMPNQSMFVLPSYSYLQKSYYIVVNFILNYKYYTFLTKIMKLHFDTILFGKSSNSIGDMKHFFVGILKHFCVGQMPHWQSEKWPLGPTTTHRHFTVSRTVGILGESQKLDGVGPVDNRLSPDYIHHFVQKNLIIHVTCDM